jgi:serine/threonine protein kinase
MRLGVYEVTAQIGEGGMGQVYRATDTTLGRQVAIKILPDPFASDPELLARFETRGEDARVTESSAHRGDLCGREIGRHARLRDGVAIYPGSGPSEK